MDRPDQSNRRFNTDQVREPSHSVTILVAEDTHDSQLESQVRSVTGHLVNVDVDSSEFSSPNAVLHLVSEGFTRWSFDSEHLGYTTAYSSVKAIGLLCTGRCSDQVKGEARSVSQSHSTVHYYEVVSLSDTSGIADSVQKLVRATDKAEEEAAEAARQEALKFTYVSRTPYRFEPKQKKESSCSCCCCLQ